MCITLGVIIIIIIIIIVVVVVVVAAAIVLALESIMTPDFYCSVSQPLRDGGPVNFFLIRRGPGPNKFTRKYFSSFFLVHTLN